MAEEVIRFRSRIDTRQTEEVSSGSAQAWRRLPAAERGLDTLAGGFTKFGDADSVAGREMATAVRQFAIAG